MLVLPIETFACYPIATVFVFISRRSNILYSFFYRFSKLNIGRKLKTFSKNL